MADSNTAGGTTTAPGAGATGTAAGTTAAGTQAAAGQGAQQVPITALHEEREKRQALAEKVEALEAQLTRLSTNSQNQATTTTSGNQQSSADSQAQLDALWRSDPRQAMRVELGGALDWADRVNMTVEEQADTMSGRKEYADFGTYRAEIMRHVRKLPLAQRGTPGVIETAYFLVKGRNSEAVSAQRTTDALNKMKAGEAAGTSTAAGGNAGGTTQTQTGLTDHERAAAAAMGVSEEEYSKYRKR